MPEKSPPDFKNMELDTDLLTTPYAVQTNWHVITGAPSCGKTTLINLLAGKKFHIAPEGARIYLERELACGRSLLEIRSNLHQMERSIAEMQLAIEQGLQVNACIFLDRAFPDCLAWYRFFNLNPNELLRDCFHFRYASVFLLDPLPLQLDNLRYKDATIQNFTGAWHMRDYAALGYRVRRVPVMTPEERLAFVLEALSSQGLV